MTEQPIDSTLAAPLETEAEAVRRCNRKFYRAFESLNMARMRAIWAEDGPVKCVHPGWKPIHGAAAVLESWEQIFQNTSYIEFELEEETVIIEYGLAVVSVVEKMRSASQGQTVKGVAHATNVFRKEGGSWRLIIHHAS